MVGDPRRDQTQGSVEWDSVELRAQDGWNRHKHSGDVDNFFYHAATIIALFSTTAATLLATLVKSDQTWIVAVFSGLATVLIGIERTFGFGPRWRDHQTLRAGYDGLLDKIKIYRAQPHWTPKVQTERLAEVMDDLRHLRRQEGIAPKAESATALDSRSEPSPDSRSKE
jgi:hypothetical protein